MSRPLRPAGQLTGPALEAALQALTPTLTAADQAAVALARRTAAAIDDGEGRISTLGPLLLATLQQLGATPAARKTLTAGTTTGNAPKTALAALRDAHRDARGA